MPNPGISRAALDVRKVLSGKNGRLYDDNGELMATMEDFSAQVSVTNQSFQPIGSGMEMGANTSYKVTLGFTEIVIMSSKFIVDLINGMSTGIMPVYNLRADMESPYDGSIESIVYRQCIPDGTIDIQNMKAGEIYKRAWSMLCNQPPDMQSMFSGN